MAQLDWFIRANLRPRHFRILVALDDLRNLGRVARSLHVSQPAVSIALGDLERGLGLKLFERTAKGVVPNAYGECLIRQARVVLASLAQARDEMQALHSGASGKIKVGALPAMTPGLLPQAIALLKEKAPLTRVMVQEGPMEALLPELRRGAVDLIVGRLPGHGAPAEVEEEALYSGHNVVVAGPRHPLARRKRVSWQELVGYPWVLPPAGTLSREPLEAMLQKHGLGMPADCLETLSIHVITGYLQRTRAVGVLSQVVAGHYIESGMLAQLPLALPDPQRPIGMTWNRHHPLSAAAQGLMRCLRESVAQMRP
ncbi:MAG TPA: LysR substrate-binding domain-containing protein [Burkholderiales bacterium]